MDAIPDQNNLRFLIVEDEPIYQTGLMTSLESNFVRATFFFAQTLAEAGKILEHHSVDVITLDIRLPDGDGIDFCKQLRAHNNTVKILGLSFFKDQHHIACMMNAGANGYLMKDADGEEICFAISQVLKGKSYIPFQKTYQQVAASIHDQEYIHHKSLTHREKEILLLICNGFTDPQISEQLYLSRSTVANHRHSIHKKTKTKNSATLVMYARENGLSG